MTRKQRRLTLIGCALAVLGFASGLVLYALRDSIVFFSTPSMAAEHHIAAGKRFRLGGLVERGSLVCGTDQVSFEVGDGGARLPVTYKGILPDLFREGQGIIAHGHLDAQGVFVADDVLAKHDEKYMPKEVVQALKKSGEWRPDGAASPAMAAGMSAQ